MAKGSLLGWELRVACVEWVHVFGIGHIFLHRLSSLASWWANNILVSGHYVLRIVLLCDCYICLHAALPTHIELPYYLSTWDTALQRIAYKGSLRSMWSGQPASGPYVHVCYFRASVLFGGSFNFTRPFHVVFSNATDRCDYNWGSGLEVDGHQYCLFHEGCSSYSSQGIDLYIFCAGNPLDSLFI